MSEDTTPELNLPSAVGGRFISEVNFRPTTYGNGYFSVIVTDTLTGREREGTAYDETEVDAVRKQTAQALVAMADASMKAPNIGRFDIPGADRDDDDSNPGDAAVSGD